MRKRLVVVLVLALAGCGRSAETTSHSTPTPTPTALPATISSRSADAAPRRHPRRRHGSAATPTATPTATSTPPAERRLTSCDANIQVDGATTTCAFAENVFYQYWRALRRGGAASFTAYSPATGQEYDVRCRSADRIACETRDESYVAFSAAAVAAYSAGQAKDYACSHDTGDPGACPAPTASSASDADAGAGGCDPSYQGACLDPDSLDYDCAGGSGDGPDYTGPVRVVGDDHFDLDRDGDGEACEPS